jgi:spore maturation protein B
VYEAFVGAAKEGFGVAVMVIPYLVAILVAIGLFRASGAMQWLTDLLAPVTSKVGFPAEALPMALIRPLSGGGARGVMAETFAAHGPDSFIGYLVSLIAGSSETTFYVLALYFGAVQVKAVRHTLAACLIADTVGLAIATLLAWLFFGDAPMSLPPG